MPRPSDTMRGSSPEPHELPDEAMIWPEPAGTEKYTWRPSAEQAAWFRLNDPEHRYLRADGSMSAAWHAERRRRWSSAGLDAADIVRIYCPAGPGPAVPDPRSVLRGPAYQVARKRRR